MFWLRAWNQSSFAVFCQQSWFQTSFFIPSLCFPYSSWYNRFAHWHVFALYRLATNTIYVRHRTCPALATYWMQNAFVIELRQGCPRGWATKDRVDSHVADSEMALRNASWLRQQSTTSSDKLLALNLQEILEELWKLKNKPRHWQGSPKSWMRWRCHKIGWMVLCTCSMNYGLYQFPRHQPYQHRMEGTLLDPLFPDFHIPPILQKYREYNIDSMGALHIHRLHDCMWYSKLTTGMLMHEHISSKKLVQLIRATIELSACAMVSLKSL